MENQMTAHRWYCHPTFSIPKCFVISSVVYFKITVVSFVGLEILFAIQPNFFLDDSKYPTAKASSFFETLPGTNRTKADLVHDAHYSVVVSFVLWAVIIYATIFVVSSALYVFCENLFVAALDKNSLLSERVAKRLKKIRDAFLVKNYKSRRPHSVLRHQFGIQSVKTYNILPSNSYEVRASLEDFMLSKSIEGTHNLHIDVILWLHDLIKTVDYMHNKKLFHLNLQPSSVFVHWLHSDESDKYSSILGDDQPSIPHPSARHDLKNLGRQKCKDPEVRIVLGDLTGAVFSENGKVNSRSVTVPEYYKAPECRGSERAVDASKVDAWGIGVVASEILTGGYIQILSCSPPGDPSLPQPLFDEEHFNNALFAMYDLKAAILQQRFLGIRFQEYDWDQAKFATDCFEFVGRLLEPDPDKRMDLKRALELPLMSKVRRPLGDAYYVNFSFI